MERAAFLLETGERLSCLLNPESVVMRRTAGVRPRRSAGGRLTGNGLADDPLLFTGGGRTELDVDLLFDTDIGGSTVETHDVTDLTGPLWNLAENVSDTAGAARLQTVRLVWGKAWNVQGVVTAVAERFERFDAAGTPQRSWLRLRMVRTGSQSNAGPPAAQPRTSYAAPSPDEVPEDQVILHDVVGGPAAGDAPGAPPEGERLDAIAAQYYGDPSLWRVLASFNGIADPTRLPPPQTIRIPPLSALRRA